MSITLERGLNVMRMFRALGDPIRLQIFEILRSCASPVSVDECGQAFPIDGPTAGEVCCQITGSDRINSTVSHHLKELRLAGLINVERRGKHMICSINQPAIEAMSEYLAKVPGRCGSGDCNQ